MLPLMAEPAALRALGKHDMMDLVAMVNVTTFTGSPPSLPAGVAPEKWDAAGDDANRLAALLLVAEGSTRAAAVLQAEIDAGPAGYDPRLVSRLTDKWREEKNRSTQPEPEPSASMSDSLPEEIAMAAAKSFAGELLEESISAAIVSLVPPEDNSTRGYLASLYPTVVPALEALTKEFERCEQEGKKPPEPSDWLGSYLMRHNPGAISAPIPPV